MNPARRTMDAAGAEGACKYCGHREAHGKTLHWTGRRWICSECWREIFDEEPPDV